MSCPVTINHRFELGWHLNKLGLTGRGVEIGVFEGQNARAILDAWDGIKVYLVDPYITQDKSEYLDGCNIDDFNSAYAKASKQLAPYYPRYQFIKEYSDKASKLFNDCELDFVYIDGNHRYSAVMKDVDCWWPKVKQGGVLAGHDYKDAFIDGIWDCGVKKAVDEWALRNNIELGFTMEDVVTWYCVKK